ncbi:hypothetical protein OGATHE_006412 [Ogataea polymorpha]|uniref:Uncharacterized protein n=1 Tax=Ogataea polymorpha TaxID=460523 RepID=A0A9P8NNQ0_9ASCO|nr:hypothetical protein OGATHE_006412 [Ogataea polymorpha]
MSSYETSLFVDHLFPSKGMYSIKRTSTLSCLLSSTKSSISSSFRFFITTTLIFTLGMSNSRAVFKLLITALSPLRRVIKRNLPLIRVSRLKLSDVNPFLKRSGNLRWSARPLDVIQISSMPEI